MWKPCSLILTIPPHLNDFRFMEILTESVRPLRPSSISVEMEIQRSPPSPASSASYISKVSSPDGFSIHGLWSVTKFKFTKLQEWYGSSLVLSSLYICQKYLGASRGHLFLCCFSRYLWLYRLCKAKTEGDFESGRPTHIRSSLCLFGDLWVPTDSQGKVNKYRRRIFHYYIDWTW